MNACAQTAFWEICFFVCFPLSVPRSAYNHESLSHTNLSFWVGGSAQPSRFKEYHPGDRDGPSLYFIYING